MAKGFQRSKPIPPPANAEAGAALIRAHALTLFDRHNGDGADWRMMADSLFKAAFDTLDRLPDDARTSMARRVHAGAYERAVGAGKGDPASSASAASQSRPVDLVALDLSSGMPKR